MQQFLQTILLIILAVVLVASLLVYLFQHRLIYFPNSHRPQTSVANAEGLQEIELHTKDKLRLLSWYKPAKGTRATVLYLHGNAGNIEQRLPIARALLTQGYGVLMLEYRGFGGNPGSPSEAGLYQDAQAAFDFLQQAQVPSHKVVLYGESLGSGVAVEMATQQRVCAVILQSPYTSLPEVARWHYPWIWIKPSDRYNSIDKITAIQAPLLITHGKKDRVVPYMQGLRLYQHANAPKKILSYSNLDHHNLWGSSYYQTLFSFIQTHCAT